MIFLILLTMNSYIILYYMASNLATSF